MGRTALLFGESATLTWENGIMRTRTVRSLLGLLLGTALIAGCGDEESGDGSDRQAQGPPFGSQQDVAMAETLWNDMEGYQETWKPWPGKEGWQEGQSPHGKWVKFYLNDKAAASMEQGFQDGSVIIKENFTQKNVDSLAAVTIMQKRQGYAPDNGDWFWVKYGPQGSVLKNPKGMSLAGRVAKGTGQGCIACHTKARGGDLVFTNDR